MKEIRVAIKDVLRNKLDYLFLFWQLYYFAGISIFVNTDESLLFNLILSFGFLIYKRKKIDKKLFSLSVIIGIIYIVTVVYTGLFDTLLLGGFFIRLIIGYLILKAYGLQFFDYFETIIFLLALISLPFFLIQVTFPEFFNLFKAISFVSTSREIAGHINIFLYHFNTWGEFRNSGFMWEPAAFGAVIAWAIIINLYRTNFKINFRIVIFFTAMFTTFSLGTYAYLLIFILAYLLEKELKKAFIIYSLIAVILILISSLSFIDDRFLFMADKYEFYMNSTFMEQSQSTYPIKVTRTQGLLISLDQFFVWPLGYGFNRDSRELMMLPGSANGFARFIITWGIIGLILLIVSYKNYLNILRVYYNSKIKYDLFYIVVFLLTMNGNPIDNKPLFLLFVITGFIFYKYSLKEKKKEIIFDDSKPVSKLKGIPLR